ncbi:MAG: T9SS type A sorting domain-containing protein [Sphingobacteriaceae bacterium]|nr:T9SS type A sorting domain-containing protein [Sphingobacteriaceae bacterium]
MLQTANSPSQGVEGKVEIINSIGQTVYTSELNTDELKVTGLAAGIYYLKTEKSIIGKKIIINN